MNLLLQMKNKTFLKYKENEVFVTAVDERGICWVIVKQNAIITLREAEENTAFVIELGNGEIMPMLVDTRGISTISKEARDHFSMRGRKGYVNSIAILTGNPLSKVVGNFFLGLNKPSVPTKLFTQEEKAVEWLNEYL